MKLIKLSVVTSSIELVHLRCYLLCFRRTALLLSQSDTVSNSARQMSQLNAPRRCISQTRFRQIVASIDLVKSEILRYKAFELILHLSCCFSEVDILIRVRGAIKNIPVRYDLTILIIHLSSDRLLEHPAASISLLYVEVANFSGVAFQLKKTTRCCASQEMIPLKTRMGCRI